MPIYEYECSECGVKFSALLSISRRDELEKTLLCPECGAEGPRRLISNFAYGTGPSAGRSASSSDCGGSDCGGGG